MPKMNKIGWIFLINWAKTIKRNISSVFSKQRFSARKSRMTVRKAFRKAIIAVSLKDGKNNNLILT